MVLASSSTVLNALLLRLPLDGVLELPLSGPAMQAMLMTFYKGSLSINSASIAQELLETANQFEITALAKQCQSYLDFCAMSLVTVENRESSTETAIAAESVTHVENDNASLTVKAEPDIEEAYCDIGEDFAMDDVDPHFQEEGHDLNIPATASSGGDSAVIKTEHIQEVAGNYLALSVLFTLSQTLQFSLLFYHCTHSRLPLHT